MSMPQRYDSSFVTVAAALFGEYLTANNLTTADAKAVKMRDFWVWCNDRVGDEAFVTEVSETLKIYEIEAESVETLLFNWQDPFLFCKSLWVFWPIIKDWYGPKNKVKPVAARLTLSLQYEDKEFSLPMMELLDKETEKVGVGRIASNWRMMLAVAEKWLMDKDLDDVYEDPSIWSSGTDKKVIPELDF